MAPDWVSQPTELPPPGCKSTVYLLDLSGWVHRFFHTTKNLAAPATCEAVIKLLRKQRARFFGVCEDSHVPTFRDELLPTYKQSRKAKRSGPERAMLLEQLRNTAEMLQHQINAKRLRAKGFEADDVIATATTMALEDGMRVVILAFDKDMTQLVCKRVVQWDGKAKIRGPVEVEAEFGVRPEQMRDYLALVGDKNDDVPGVLGIGDVAARALLQHFGSADAALRAAQQAGADAHPFYGSHLKMWAKLHGSVPVQQYELSKQLVSLRTDVPLRIDGVDELLLR